MLLQACTAAAASETNNGPQEGSCASPGPLSMHRRGWKQWATESQQAWAMCPGWRLLCTLAHQCTTSAEGRKGQLTKTWRDFPQFHHVLSPERTCTHVHTQRHTHTTHSGPHHTNPRCLCKSRLWRDKSSWKLGRMGLGFVLRVTLKKSSSHFLEAAVSQGYK